jgi:DeoR/GlpR family transcriptional regulator of sugar metabolism
MTTQEQHEAIASYIRSHPELRYWEVAVKLNISTGTVTRVAKEYSLGRGSGRSLNLNTDALEEK